MQHDNSQDSLSDKLMQKYLDKIVKLQQDQETSRQQESELLRMHLAQMNVLLDQLINVSGSGSTIAATKKFIPFQTGNFDVAQQIFVSPITGLPDPQVPPPSSDSYLTRIDVYKINDNKVVPHMTLINNGPGDVFFISAYANEQFNTKEETLHVNDQRELFNVFQLRLRSSLPTTAIRLIEGIVRTGATGINTANNIVVKPTIQTNQTVLTFSAIFDIFTPTINITSPIVETFLNLPINPAIQSPLPPGATATLVNNATGVPMPFTIPEGFVVEAFSAIDNMSTDHTFRLWVEFLPFILPGEFTETGVFPVSNRGPLFSLQLNLQGQFTTEVVDRTGAPVGGRKFLFTVTNDDPFNNMIGTISFLALLIRVR